MEDLASQKEISEVGASEVGFILVTSKLGDFAQRGPVLVGRH